MKILLSSKWLEIRRMEESDVEWFMWAVKKPHFNEGQLHKYKPMQESKLKQAIIESMPHRKVIKLNGVRIGGVSLVQYFEGLELSYFILEEFEGRGYMSEILGALLEQLKNVNVYCNILESNKRSIKLAERAGFVCIGVEGNIVRMVKLVEKNG